MIAKAILFIIFCLACFSIIWNRVSEICSEMWILRMEKIKNNKIIIDFEAIRKQGIQQEQKRIIEIINSIKNINYLDRIRIIKQIQEDKNGKNK